MGVRRHTEETKAKMRASQKARAAARTPEERERIRQHRSAAVTAWWAQKPADERQHHREKAKAVKDAQYATMSAEERRTKFANPQQDRSAMMREVWNGRDTQQRRTIARKIGAKRRRWLARCSDSDRAELLSQLRRGQDKAARGNPSSLEQTVESWLKALPLAHGFQKQKWIGPYRVDFYLPRWGSWTRVVVEVQGCYWHRCAQCGYEDRDSKREYDTARIGWLLAHGFQVMELWEHDIKQYSRNPFLDGEGDSYVV